MNCVYMRCTGCLFTLKVHKIKKFSEMYHGANSLNMVPVEINDPELIKLEKIFKTVMNYIACYKHILCK